MYFYFSVQPMPRGDHVLNFSDAEDMLNDEDLKYVIHIMTSYNVFSDWLTSLVMFFDKRFMQTERN
jgi:hypothetical protein